jgi:hypothetical protein
MKKFILASILCIAACTPAQSAVWSQVEQTVLADLENGKVLTLIEQDVAALAPSIAGDAAAIDAVIQEAINLLEGLGAIPVVAQPTSTAVKMALKAKTAK